MLNFDTSGLQSINLWAQVWNRTWKKTNQKTLSINTLFWLDSFGVWVQKSYLKVL